MTESTPADCAPPDRGQPHRVLAHLLGGLEPEFRAVAARRLARERRAVNTGVTDLLHDALVCLLDRGAGRNWTFTPAEIEVIVRNMLIDRARRRGATKRGGGVAPQGLEAAAGLSVPENGMIDNLREALALLADRDPQWYAALDLHYMQRLTVPAVARELGVSPRTVDRYLHAARQYLHDVLSHGA
ncbi:MAG: ECF-type sigma factor [Planctomycetota bacterium]